MSKVDLVKAIAREPDPPCLWNGGCLHAWRCAKFLLACEAFKEYLDIKNGKKKDKLPFLPSHIKKPLRKMYDKLYPKEDSAWTKGEPEPHPILDAPRGPDSRDKPSRKNKYNHIIAAQCLGCGEWRDVPDEISPWCRYCTKCVNAALRAHRPGPGFKTCKECGHRYRSVDKNFSEINVKRQRVRSQICKKCESNRSPQQKKWQEVICDSDSASA